MELYKRIGFNSRFTIDCFWWFGEFGKKFENAMEQSYGGRVKKVVIAIILVFGVVFFYLLKESKGDLLNPLSLIRSREEKVEKMEVMGFLPSWMVGKTRLYGEEIDRLVFLGIELNGEGELVWEVQSNRIYSQNYKIIKEEVARKGGKNIIGIKQFDDDLIHKILSEEEIRKKAIKEIAALVEEEGFDGVNIDFEFQGDPLAILGEEMGLFLDELSEANVGEVSIDVFANTIIKGGGEDLQVFMSKVDQVVVMAYDFHRPGVDYVGPVAPVGSKIGERNISEVGEKVIFSGLDKNKIVMAYPLYGYEWKTEEESFESKIIRGWYQMASFRRVKELIEGGDYKIVEGDEELKEGEMRISWDDLSMTPWLAFVEEGEIRQIYYENWESLGAKMDLVRQYQLGGVGFWALGYEGDDVDFWLKMGSILSK